MTKLILSKFETVDFLMNLDSAGTMHIWSKTDNTEIKLAVRNISSEAAEIISQQFLEMSDVLKNDGK